MPGSPGRGFFFARRIAAKIAQAAGTTAQGLTLASVPVGDVEVLAGASAMQSVSDQERVRP